MKLIKHNVYEYYKQNTNLYDDDTVEDTDDDSQLEGCLVIAESPEGQTTEEDDDVDDTNSDCIIVEEKSTNTYNEQDNVVTEDQQKLVVVCEPMDIVDKPICSCCSRMGAIKSLWKENSGYGVTEVYGTMLNECFALSWNQPLDPDLATEKICERCIARLRDAVTFKQEVIATANSLNAFTEVITPEAITGPFRVIASCDPIQGDLGTEIKQEIVIDVDVNVAPQPEFLHVDNACLGDEDTGLVDGEDHGEVETDDDPIVIQERPKREPPWLVKRKPQASEPPKKYKKYTQEDVKTAVDAVMSQAMTQNTAAKTLKVPCRVLSRALKIAGYVKAKPESRRGKKKRADSPPGPRSRRVPSSERKKQLYPEQNLQRAVDEVWNNRMSQSEASRVFDVPRSTIFDEINKKKTGKPRTPAKKKGDEGPFEMVKHTTNILTIMENSNATPIRSHGDGGYMCCFCDKQYHDPSKLKNHTIHCHDWKTKKTLTKGKRPSSYFVKLDVTDLECSICEADMDTVELLMEHLLKDHNKKIYTDIKNHILPFKFDSDDLRCTICFNVYNKFKLLQEHLNVHYQNYKCEVCGAGYVSRMILHNHTRGHKIGEFTCELCQKVFSTQRKLNYHKSLVHRNSYMVSKCGYCNEKFKSYQRKLEHLTEVHNVKPMTYKCKACNRSFNSQPALRMHMNRDHLMVRRYRCAQCHKAFFAKAELSVHLLMHTGVREFQCDICKKLFKRKFTLREHLRIHENNYRFQCDDCEVAFVQKCSWKSHMRTKHGMVF